MSLIHRLTGLALLMAADGVPSEVQGPELPLADCARCKYRTPDGPGAHCHMFKEKPDDRCGQFRAETWADVARATAAEELQAERRRRKAEAWAKRQPKGKS